VRAYNNQKKPIKRGGHLNELTVVANGKKISRIEDSNDGTYTFDYNVTWGDNKIESNAKGRHVLGFPFSIRMNKDNVLDIVEPDASQTKTDQEKQKAEDLRKNELKKTRRIT